MRTKKIILYDEPGVPQIQIKRLEGFLAGAFPVTVERRENVFGRAGIERMESARIYDLGEPFQKQPDAPIKGGGGAALYDGFEVCGIASEFAEDAADTLHIAFTDMLTCTFEESDCRYHARALIGPNPAIVSTAGMVEAPARPRRYYIDQMAGIPQKELDGMYGKECLQYNDPRTSQIAEGYLLQAVMYYETGDAFCEHRDCRLYNAHWQKDLFFSQLESKRLCKKHQTAFEKMTKPAPSCPEDIHLNYWDAGG